MNQRVHISISDAYVRRRLQQIAKSRGRKRIGDVIPGVLSLVLPHLDQDGNWVAANSPAAAAPQNPLPASR